MDRLLGAEYSSGLVIGYQYDGNGNIITQVYLTQESSANGLPVLWKFFNGLSITDTSGTNSLHGDADGDGWSNYQEWKAGTSPVDFSSVPDLKGLLGSNIASLELPFTPANFVVGVGQMDGTGADEIVIGADGNPGATTNTLLILTQNSTGWNTQRLDIGPFGVTSLAIGQLSNRPAPAIYAGLRQSGGNGRIVELLHDGGVWQTNIVASSTNEGAYVLGTHPGYDLVATLATTNAPEGALYSLFWKSNEWQIGILAVDSSRRTLGRVGNRPSVGLVVGRLLDNDKLQILTARTTPAMGQSLQLDGIDDYVSIPAAAINNLTQGTIEARMYLNSINAGAITIKQVDGIDTMAFFSVGASHEINPGVPGKLYYKGHNPPPSLASSTQVIDTGKWYDLAVSFSSSSASFFINGHLDSKFNGDYSIPDNLSARAVTSLGVWWVSGAGYQYLNGYIDELRIWNRALSEAEIAANMNITLLANEPGLVACWAFEDGTARDSSGNGFDGQFKGGAQTVSNVNNIYLFKNYIIDLGSPGTLVWLGSVIDAGITRSQWTDNLSTYVSYVDDRNRSGTIDDGDDFVTSEYSLGSTNASLLGLTRQPISSATVAQSYGLASVNFLNSNSEVLFTSEPDGQLFSWTATNATGPLQCQLFSAQHAGKGWPTLAAVKTLEPGEGLVGLRVDPAKPNVCDVIFWPPQPELWKPVDVPQTAPITRILPEPNAGGSLAELSIRLWDAEGNNSSIELQYQLPEATNWLTAAISSIDGAAYASVSALPTGVTHRVIWNAGRDSGIGFTNNVSLRARARDVTLTGDWSDTATYQLAIPLIVDSDTDKDGLPDDWEVARFGDLNQGYTDDSDQDGFSNGQEYIADTDPTDASSYLRLSVIRPENNDLVIEWQGGRQARQFLERRIGLGYPNERWITIWTNEPPTETSGSCTDRFDLERTRFYRLRAVRE